MSAVGFEYKNKKGETPFETFLRYTNEKEKSAVKLASILQGKVREDAHILDIGTGNGEYLELALSRLDIPRTMRLTLVEPSDDLAGQLEGRFSTVVPRDNLTVAVADLQGFETDERFDVILMSHLFYHIPRATWTEELAKALSLLKPGGALIVVLREKDDAYDFKMAFKPLLFNNPSFKALTIDDVLEVLPKETAVRVMKRSAESELVIPVEESKEDTISIIEFYLNKEWKEIPPDIRQSSLDFIAKRKNTFTQVDGIAVIEKAA